MALGAQGQPVRRIEALGHVEEIHAAHIEDTPATAAPNPAIHAGRGFPCG